MPPRCPRRGPPTSLIVKAERAAGGLADLRGDIHAFLGPRFQLGLILGNGIATLVLAAAGYLVIRRQLDAAWICGYPFAVHRDALALVGVPVWKGRPLYQSYMHSAR